MASSVVQMASPVVPMASPVQVASPVVQMASPVVQVASPVVQMASNNCIFLTTKLCIFFTLSRTIMLLVEVCRDI